MPYQIEPARLDWGTDNVPVSRQYGDVYYSREHGLAESRFVFLDHNHLAERWRVLEQHRFIIGETGFGTGLNFLACWHLWQQACALHTTPKTLQFVSVEKHPVSRADLKKALSHWPELRPLAQQLAAQYPPLIRGHHRLQFELAPHTVVLDLIFDDAEQGFGNLLATSHPQLIRLGSKIDAWFLDGFAPDSNPGMWSDTLFDQIAALSDCDTSFATFTAAGFVRRALAGRGFQVEKVRGFGRKREMLRGVMRSSPALTSANRHSETAAWHLPAQTSARPQSVAVIGAGLAGAHTAFALARRGLEVTVFEAANTLGAGSSGNPQGILYTKLSHQAGQLNRFALCSFLHALRFYQGLEGLPGDRCGVFQLLGREQWSRLKETFNTQDEWCRFIEAGEASIVTGLPIQSPGVFYPTAGWLRPVELCRKLLDGKKVHLHTDTPVSNLEYKNRQWQLHTPKAVFSADCVVVANSHHAQRIAQLQHLPIKAVRGQLTYLPPQACRTLPKTVICHEGYVAPPVDDTLIIGASYDTRSSSTELRDAEHNQNLDKLAAAIPEMLSECSVSGGRASLRCTSPDYLPIIGPAPDAEAQQSQFNALSKDAKKLMPSAGAYLPNLYVNLAHGSRGLTSTVLGGELVASMIGGELLPLPRDLVRALSPSRFLIRELVRRNGRQT